MTKTNIIVAICKNRGIGYKNTIPWGYLKRDMEHFRKLTIGEGNNAIVMGKNTFLSLPKGPLPRRDNLILSKSFTSNDVKYYKDKYIGLNFDFFTSINDLNIYIKSKEYDIVWIIGGEQIYNLYINLPINEIHVTYIDEEYVCDTFFPEIQNMYFISKTLKTSYEVKNKNKDIKEDKNEYRNENKNDGKKIINVYNILYKS